MNTALPAIALALAAGSGGATVHAEPTEGSPTINRDRTAIVLIEFQNEWVAPDGALRKLLVKDDAQFQAAIDNGADVLRAARERGWTIAHAGLDLTDDASYQIFGPADRALGLRRAIQNAGTWTGDGVAFPAPFTPEEGEFVVAGRSGASVLMNSTLDAYLRNNDINTVIFMGFATHVCVESSLREAHDRGLNAYVITDASGAFEDAQNTYFQDHVLHHFGKGITAGELISLMKSANG